jgi:hypothetical protein
MSFELSDQTSDSFEELLFDLPKFSNNSDVLSYPQHQQETFQYWLINRFDRVGLISVSNYLKKSYVFIINHWKLFFVISLFCLFFSLP